jgi:mRNA export factor
MTTFGSTLGSTLGSPGGNYNANKDIEVASPPTDSISSLSFSPVANYLVATSWDNQVRCYEIQQNGQSAGKAAISHEQPPLCSAWSADGTTVFTGGPHHCPITARLPFMSTPSQVQRMSHCTRKHHGNIEHPMLR